MNKRAESVGVRVGFSKEMQIPLGGERMKRKTFMIWNSEKEVWEDSSLTIDEAFPAQSWWSKLCEFVRRLFS